MYAAWYPPLPRDTTTAPPPDPYLNAYGVWLTHELTMLTGNTSSGGVLKQLSAARGVWAQVANRYWGGL